MPFFRHSSKISRSFFHYHSPSRSLSHQNPTLNPNSSLACRLTARAVIRFRGPDAAKFLQGLLTNDVRKLSCGDGSPTLTSYVSTPNVPFKTPAPIYSALLTPQGRFLYDLFLYRAPSGETKLDRTGSGPGSDKEEQELTVLADVDAVEVEEILGCFKNGRGRGGGKATGTDRIDALGRLLTRILRHMASELKLDVRRDGYVRVRDLLSLNMTTYAKVPLKSHTVEDIKEAVRKDNKQRFSLLEENGEFFIRANQGHTITTINSESLLKPILLADEVPVCVHGTYKRNLESILQCGLKRMSRLHVHFSSGLPTDGEVISGMRRDVNIMIFLDVRKALQEGMKLYISDNRVILTEGFDGVVPVKYFEKIETWPGRERVQF